jgi:hypothetical protein
MLQDLIDLEERFQPYLLNNDYTFIGPVDQQLLNPFISRANDLAPIVSILRTVHHALSHKQSTRHALAVLPPNAELRIYVVYRSLDNDSLLIHGTIEGYCQKNKFDFPLPQD